MQHSLDPTLHLPAQPMACADASCGCDHGSLPGHHLGASNAVALSDWGHLLTAVKGRLAQIAAASEPLAPTPPGGISDQLLECVGALDQLQLTLAHELGCRQQLEQEIFDARATLALAQAGESKARHQSRHDGLTTLPNRSHFCERLDRCTASAERAAFAVLYLDLDGFKSVNDEHGHDAGDELLKVISARLARAVRADDVVGRLGGDEFGLLLGGMAARGLLVELANKLMAAVEAPVRLGALTLHVSASIGIATFPADGESVDALLRNADAAMYVAKRKRCGHAFFAEYAEAGALPQGGAQRSRRNVA